VYLSKRDIEIGYGSMVPCWPGCGNRALAASQIKSELHKQQPGDTWRDQEHPVKVTPKLLA
jgi:hypothetical protein